MTDKLTITLELTREQAETWQMYGFILGYADDDPVGDALSGVQDALDEAVDAVLVVPQPVAETP